MRSDTARTHKPYGVGLGAAGLFYSMRFGSGVQYFTYNWADGTFAAGPKSLTIPQAFTDMGVPIFHSATNLIYLTVPFDSSNKALLVRLDGTTLAVNMTKSLTFSGVRHVLPLTSHLFVFGSISGNAAYLKLDTDLGARNNPFITVGDLAPTVVDATAPFFQIVGST